MRHCVQSLARPSPVDVTINRDRGNREQANKIEEQRREKHEQTNPNQIKNKLGYEGLKMQQNKQQQYVSVGLE